MIRYLAILSCFFLSLKSEAQPDSFNVNDNLDYCVRQVRKSLLQLPAVYDSLPRSIEKGYQNWTFVNYKDWTSGFWPGILWYTYEYSQDSILRNKAALYSQAVAPLAFSKAFHHDIGFQVNCSFGNAYRLTGDPEYKKILLAAADTLATLFNPKVGTILSWPNDVKRLGGHNTIIDNMMNLELLFWASKHGGSRRLYHIAVTHAITTMENHFRPDYSSYHVLVYDTLTGKPIRKITHQGYADNSIWARGQAWAIYGFTVAYRETKNPVFLNFVVKVADRYLRDLPDDLVPYWDFNAPDIPSAPKDASAAAITASALLELSTFVKNKSKAFEYRYKAEKMLLSLSSPAYQSRSINDAFLLHCTGNKPGNGEVDASIIYADYYYVEALLRLRNIKAKAKIF
jgi:unsaturated chondroitin disaccharide hydrolase